jgi:DNA-directed RNA polymerase specialized sigma24 family protein
MIASEEPLKLKSLTRDEWLRLIRMIGSDIKCISPVTRLHAIGWLTRQMDRRQLWTEPQTVHDALEVLLHVSDQFEARQRRRLDRAVISANLPDDLSGPIYLRGWQKIHRYDCRKASLEAWLWGFVPRVRREMSRPGGATTFGDLDDSIDVEDLSSVDPAEAISELDFENTFADLIAEHLGGFDRGAEIDHELTLLDIWRQALWGCWEDLDPSHREIIEAVYCDDRPRKEVAPAFGYNDRNPIDKILSRFRRDVTRKANFLRDGR